MVKITSGYSPRPNLTVFWPGPTGLVFNASKDIVCKIAGHPAAPGRLYMQNHGGWADWSGPGGPRPDIGVLRSDDHGKTWRSIAKGLPSDFGFPIVVHPQDPHTVYVMPLEPMTRACCRAAAPGGLALSRTAAARWKLAEWTCCCSTSGPFPMLGLST